MGIAERAPWLTVEELERLSSVWENWAGGATTPARVIARARLHLFFLLARYGGLRSSEISSFPEQAFDRRTGLLQLKDRKLFLPPRALRSMRRILTLPEAANSDFLRMDAGFLRRTFYEVGRLANLRPESCAPRALRYARALELLDMHMPPETVAVFLGITDPLRLTQLRPQAGSGRENTFPALIAALETDYRAGRLFLRTAAGLELSAIASLSELAELDPAAGKSVTARIAPSMIFPSSAALPMINHLAGETVAASRDGIETRLRFKVKGGLELAASLDAALPQNLDLRKGSEVNLYIPAHAIKVAPPE